MELSSDVVRGIVLIGVACVAIVLLLIVLGIITYVPILTLWLPDLLRYIEEIGYGPHQDKP